MSVISTRRGGGLRKKNKNLQRGEKMENRPIMEKPWLVAAVLSFRPSVDSASRLTGQFEMSGDIPRAELLPPSLLRQLAVFFTEIVSRFEEQKKATEKRVVE